MKPSEDQEQHLRQQETSFRSRHLHGEQPTPTQTESRFLKALHWMRCPKCGQQLAAEKIGSVEIEACPNCRGIWLDATKLEAILEAKSR